MNSQRREINSKENKPIISRIDKFGKFTIEFKNSIGRKKLEKRKTRVNSKDILEMAK